MKNRYLKLLPLIIALPTLMGNAPVPQVFTNTYKDYQLTYLNVEQSGDYYYYHYNLKNTGSGYISHLSLSKEYEEYYFFATISTINQGGHYGVYPFFDKGLYQPGFDDEIMMLSTRLITDIDKVSVSCEGYSVIDSDVYIAGTRNLSLRNHRNEGDHSVYFYELDIKLVYDDPNRDWNFGVVADLTYDGNNYYIKIDERGDYIIESSQELDLSKLTINNLTVIKSHSYDYGCRGGMEKLATILLIIVILFFVMISVGIFSAIFFPAMARRRRRRREVAKK